MTTTRPLYLIALTMLGSVALPAQNASPGAALAQAVGPFLQKNCQSCHNANLPSGNLDLQALLADANSLAARVAAWENVAYQLRSGSMSPAGAPRPAKADSEGALELISRALAANPKAGGSPVAQNPSEPSTTDWLTYSYDGERTGWMRGEAKITKATAAQLQLQWRLQTDTVPNPINRYSTLTDPVVVNNVPTRDGPKKIVFVGSRDNSLYAIDGDKGTLLWKRAYPNNSTPPIPDTGNCPNNMNATPVVDRQKGIVYFLPNDGKRRGLSISDGEDRFPATAIAPQYTRNFSLNLIDGRIYTGTTRGCANTVSRVVSINVNDPTPLKRFTPAPAKGPGLGDEAESCGPRSAHSPRPATALMIRRPGAGPAAFSALTNRVFLPIRLHPSISTTLTPVISISAPAVPWFSVMEAARWWPWRGNKARSIYLTRRIWAVRTTGLLCTFRRAGPMTSDCSLPRVSSPDRGQVDGVGLSGPENPIWPFCRRALELTGSAVGEAPTD
jgi:outer membrane protein assembly factor BamB